MAKKTKEQLAEKVKPAVHKNVIDGKVEIIKQYLQEKDYAIKLRQVKINNWIKNEEGYNGVTQKTLLTRSNLHAPVLFEGVQNMASKIGGMPDFDYDTIPEGDENAAEIMKHVVKEDLDECDFDQTYEESKIEAGIYGKTIYEVIPGNDRNRVELVDTLAFLISPIAKKTKTALYQGRQFIYKTHWQLDDEADKMEYDTQSLQDMKDEKVYAELQGDASSEASLKNIRNANMGLANTSNYGSKVAEITEWWTYIKGKLTVLTVANETFLLRKVLAKDLGLKRPPFVAWGTYNRGITFWCPSVADIYRDPNLAVDVNLNQQIDNNTYRNFGMSFVSSRSGLKQNSIVPRPLGLTPVEVAPKEKISDHIYTPEVPQISDAIVTMQTIKGFADAASGLLPAPQSSKGKMSVTKQAQLNAEVQDKVKNMKKNATKAFRELVQLMADITASKLTKPRPVKIFGYKNLDIENVTKKNFNDVKLQAKATPSEDSDQNKALKQKAKIDLYTLFKDDKLIPGQVAMRRSVAKTFDIPPQEIEDWFTAENKDKENIATDQATPVQDGSGGPTPDGKAPTEATPLLSQTGKEAAAQVPRKITP